jgi:hypothetical protein
MVIPWNMLAKFAVGYNDALCSTYTSVSAMNRSSIFNSLKEDRSIDDRDPLGELRRLILEVEAPRQLLSSNIKLDPLRTLQQFHNRQATDPRDKVFGLLGLLKEMPIQPDYNMGVGEVFTQVSTNVLVQSQSLDLLAGHRSSKQSELASWCSNWADTCGAQEWQRLICLRHYRASRDLQGHVRLHHTNSGPVLEVEAKAVARIRWTVSTSAPEDGASRFKAIHEQWKQEMHGWSSSDAFWRSLCGDMLFTGEGQGPAGAFKRAIGQDSSRYQSWIQDDRAKQNRKSSVYGEAFAKSYIPPEHVTRARNEFYYAMETMTAGRRMFITTKGQIGIGPAACQEGDIIAVIKGSRVPLVLRVDLKYATCTGEDVVGLIPSTGPRRSSAFACRSKHLSRRLVGDAYVSGIMDGEAVPSAKDGRVSSFEPLYIL